MNTKTILFCALDFADKRYYNVSEVRADIQEVENRISCLKERMIAYGVCTEPRKIFFSIDDRDRDFTKEVPAAVTKIFDDLMKYAEELAKLRLLEKKWIQSHKKGGGLRKLPSFVSPDCAYLDYVVEE